MEAKISFDIGFNAYNWYNAFILFDFVHEVWKMFRLV